MKKLLYSYPKFVIIVVFLHKVYKGVHQKDAEEMANKADHDQMYPSEAIWSGSTLFAQTCVSKTSGSSQKVIKWKLYNAINSKPWKLSFFRLFWPITCFNTEDCACIWTIIIFNTRAGVCISINICSNVGAGVCISTLHTFYKLWSLEVE